MKLFVPGKLNLAKMISHLKDNTSYFCSGLIFSFVIFEENVHVVIVRNCIDVFHAAVTHFNFISVEYLVKGVVFWEMGI